MPDFTARIFSGSTLVPFEDSATPPRTNPRVGHPHRYQRVSDVSTGPIVAKATVAGVEGEIDANLGGRLFTWWWASWPNYPAAPPAALPVIVLSAGQSSVATISNFPASNPNWVGHWVLMCRRTNGGGVMLPFDVEVVA